MRSLCLLFALASLSVHAQTTFVVTSTSDFGSGSLREAITEANSASNGAAPDTIRFDIAGSGPFTIRPRVALPTITEAVVIDGLSQPGADCAVWPATLRIVLDGQSAGIGVDGLLFEGGGGSTVRGIVVQRFDGDGIQIKGAGGNRFECNFVGTDVTGMEARPNNDDGFDIAAPDNVVGGNTPSARNVVSGNGEDGIDIDGFGTNATGNRIQGNYVGVAADGVKPLGNADDGIEAQFGANGTLIGGDAATEGNVVAHNGDSGVQIEEARNNPILGNAIYDNAELGIDLDADDRTPNDPGDADGGANQRQNHPDLATATSAANTGRTTVEGTLNSRPSARYRVELFANSMLDPGGYGEGETYLGAIDVTTDATGNAAFAAELAVLLDDGTFVTATATDADGNTSEFSLGIEVDVLNNVASDDAPDAGLAVSVAPNPAASRAAVRVSLATAGAVSISLHDLLGRTVAVVPSAPLAAGDHHLAVPLSEVPAGVYLLRVQVDGDVRSVPLTIAR